MNRSRQNQRGIALITVLLMVGIITAVTLQLNRDTRTEIYEAANLSDRFRLRYVAESALQAGGAILLADANTFDALTELWANTEMLALQFDRLFDNASFKVTIEDEGGKIAVNQLVSGGNVNLPLREMLLRLLTGTHFRLEKRPAEDLLDAIQDWLDPDDEVTGGGAEGAYYAGRPQPYEAKNAPLDCIEELLMVKGMTRELFYGTAESPGLVRCLTVFGDGRININTAPAPVLLALAEEMRPEDVERLVEYRRDLRNDLSIPVWYQQITQPAGIEIPPALIVVRSDTFQITAIGFQGLMEERVTAIVRRGADRRKVTLLSWKVA